MQPLQTISDYEALNILSDVRRLEILRALMARPATLTHLGRVFDVHPAKARYHVKQLERAGLVALTHTQKVSNYTEKFYRATAKAFSVQLAILPDHGERSAVLVSGSDDLALNRLAKILQEDDQLPDLFTLPVGSLDGLIALRQGICQMAGCHLLDAPSGEYNAPYVRHLFPGQPMRLITLARRQQGLLVAPGNPLGIQGIEDLPRAGVRFINRKLGSGTRLWLDEMLRERGIASQDVRGYEDIADTHLAIAGAVAAGQADVGIAVFAAARAQGVNFIPLFEERFDLVVAEDAVNWPTIAPVFEMVNSGSFRSALSDLPGYSVQAAGDEIIIE